MCVVASYFFSNAKNNILKVADRYRCPRNGTTRHYGGRATISMLAWSSL
jgi:hypothetical protein